MSDPSSTLPLASAPQDGATSTSSVAPAVKRRRFSGRGIVQTLSRWTSTAISRRRAFDSVIIGLLLTLLVISFDSAGWLSRIEFLLYDARAEHFQFFLPPPTNKLVHLDIDEGAIEAVRATEKERFPWPRQIMAELMDELAMAKPKVVGLDIIFPEPQKTGYAPTEAVASAGGDVVSGTFAKVQHDKLFGDSLKRLGCALVPVSLVFKHPDTLTPLQEAIRAELAQNVNLTQADLVARLQARGVDTPGLADKVAQEYLAAWRFQMSALIRREVRAAPVALDLVKKKLLKLDNLDLVLDRTFDELYDESISAARMLRFSRAIPENLPVLFDTQVTNLPVPELAAAAAYSGNIEYPTLPDGRIRAVPLFAKANDRMYPQMGLAMVLAQLDVNLDNLRFEPGYCILPLPDGREIRIPHRAYESIGLKEKISTFVDIPWWGDSNWAYMYDYPKHETSAVHVSIVALWDLVLTKRKMMSNAPQADGALISLLAVAAEDSEAEKYAAQKFAFDDVDSRQKAYDAVMAKIKADQTEEFIRSFPEADRDERSKRFLAAYDRMPALMKEYHTLSDRLRDGRAEMTRKMGGKSVLIGWTATGVAADFVPTSIHPKCPGVVLHGAIFNGIMTGELWRTLPRWMTYALTGLLGVCMTAAAAFFTPSRALIVALGLMAGYIAFNGLLLFDYGNFILGAAGPLLCVAGVWQGCTLIRLIVERYQRNRIEGRFRSYVDPALVDYVVEHPDQIKLEGQIREMTVCFTDLGNFTPLTAQLKEATVPLLNRIFDAMVPEIRGNNGYVNKFLGDGIMFFFGAPRKNANHARDALRTVLSIQDAMRTVNAELSAKGLVNITLRAGVNTGNMVVGDAGSEKASDYTVLGDDVNLSSRMESANKQLGTTMLVSQRTVDLAGDDGVLIRPVGQIRVVGRDEPVVAYEIMCRNADATESQNRLAALTRTMVGAYREARFENCLQAASDMVKEFGSTKLSALYEERCQYFLDNPPTEPFDCTLTLAEK